MVGKKMTWEDVREMELESNMLYAQARMARRKRAYQRKKDRRKRFLINFSVVLLTYLMIFGLVWALEHVTVVIA